jgi:L-ascorbate 6-phosphate lactonase
MKLAEQIESTKLKSCELAVFYLAQAGFYFKTDTGKTVCVDPYLSDCCERMFNFKRMLPPPMKMTELRTDFLVSTHSHADHLDPDLLDCVKMKPETKLVGSPDCLPVYKRAGVADDRITILASGESKTVDGVGFRAVYADHGEPAANKTK